MRAKTVARVVDKRQDRVTSTRLARVGKLNGKLRELPRPADLVKL